MPGRRSRVPSVVVEGDELAGGMAAVVDQRGGQPVVRGVSGAVGAGDGDSA